MTPSVLGKALFLIAIAVSAAAAVLRPSEAIIVLLIVPFALVGAVLTVRRPAHPIGWLFGTFAATFAISVYAGAYATAGLAATPEWPAARLAAWAFAWIWLLYVSQLQIAFLLFPTGRFAGPRWRWVARTVLVLNAVHALVRAFRPGPLEDRTIDNPFGIDALAVLPDPSAVFVPIFLFGMLLALGSPLARLRHTTGVEREQIKWVAAAGVMLAVSTFVSGALQQLGVDPTFSDLAYSAGVVAVPVAMGVAILRYRLYDIEVIIRRTLIYGSVLVSLALAYVGGVIFIQGALRPFTSGSEIAVAASTLLTVALFQPVRRRVQTFVDRRFYRSRYDATRTLDDFSVRLRDHVALDAVRSDLLEAARETVQPTHVSVWLRE